RTGDPGRRRRSPRAAPAPQASAAARSYPDGRSGGDDGNQRRRRRAFSTTIAISSEVDTGPLEENASDQRSRTSFPIQSEAAPTNRGPDRAWSGAESRFTFEIMP